MTVRRLIWISILAMTGCSSTQPSLSPAGTRNRAEKAASVAASVEATAIDSQDAAIPIHVTASDSQSSRTSLVSLQPSSRDEGNVSEVSSEPASLGSQDESASSPNTQPPGAPQQTHSGDATTASDTPPPGQTDEPSELPDRVPDNLFQFDSNKDALDDAAGITLESVIASVHLSYPLVFAAYQERAIADGNQLAAWGQFDTKLKASSENGPLGFYQTYRNGAGFETPIYQGGEVFAGYRVGRGSFQPWYKERQTDDSGEFKGGIRVPLIRDRDIDERRAELWRRTYDQQIANPVIRANLVAFSREAGRAYWKWVASGGKYRVGVRWLELADARNAQVQRRVDEGDLDPPELIDNRRAIAKRRAKLEDASRELQQSALKLSMFLRTDTGLPYVPTVEDLPGFPELLEIDEALLGRDIMRAQQNRPELAALELELKRLQVDYAEACNMTQPGLDAQIIGSQDLGPAATRKGDKSPFELEAGLYFDVPLQRRKGRGKMFAVQAKMSQVTAKRNLVRDKVTAEVQSAYAGLVQSLEQARQARVAVDLALRMAEIELRKFEVGESDLLKVTLREQYALDAAEEEIMAKLNYFTAFTDYAATLAIDRPSTALIPGDNGN